MWFSLLVRSLAVLALAAAPAAYAEDIDLFLKTPLSDVARPNLLLVIDNAASNNSTIGQLPYAEGTKKLDMIRDVLNILSDPMGSKHFPPCAWGPIPPGWKEGDPKPRDPDGCLMREEVDSMLSSINLGLMLFNPSSATTGAYVRYHIRPMSPPATDADPDNRKLLWAEVSGGIPTANNAPYAKAMHEAYLYFGGKPAYAGFSSSEYDSAAKDGSNYKSPAADSCQPNFILFLGNGGPDTGEDKDAGELLAGLGGILSSDPLRFSPSNFQSSWLDEYARTLNRQDLNPLLAGDQIATTYTVAIQSPTDKNYDTAGNKSSRELLKSAALAGGGEYALGSDGAEVLKAIFNALRKMQPVNSVFAAVTLPVSVNVRGTYLNQVYMGQFRPDPNARPRWPGNLKQYQIGLDDGGNPVLTDRSTPAEVVEDKKHGFLLPTITSFWTKPSSYWSFKSTMDASDDPDGAVVEKGGAAQRMRTDFATATKRADRKLYTCNGSCGTPGTGTLLSAVFADSNTDANGPTSTSLGVTTTVARTALIDWVRGADNMDDENKNLAFDDSRAYIHGDLLHSRPAVVNYNRNGDDRDIVVYYGSNDGIFRAIKGGQDDADGWEKWGIVFPEFFGSLKSLRDNDTVIAPGTPKPYFADGAVSVYQNDVNKDGKLVAADGDKVYIYIGMRRGGRFMYALDVSDPDQPKFLWKIDTDTTDTQKAATGTKVYTGLGQSWSTLRPSNIRAVTSDPVVIFGGGYDPVNEDPIPALASNSMGQGIYVVNARTGELIKHISPTGMGSIAADLTVVDRDSDGKADRIYAADSKGNIWRVDIDKAEPKDWVTHHIAALGGTGADGRKFLNKVDVVFGKTFDAVIVGSGDREHPFETNIVDRFYMLQDTFVGLIGGQFCTTSSAAVPCTHAHLSDITSNPYQNSSLPVESNGWFYTFATGEKLVSSPVTVFGTIIFGTNQPTESDPGTCGNLGKATLYQIGFKTGNAVQDLNGDGVVSSTDRSEVLAGGGFPPSAVYSPVEIKGKRRDVVCVGTHCFKPGGANFDTRRHRTYWYKNQ
jgi:type IV pilus assembly protein PilY1